MTGLRTGMLGGHGLSGAVRQADHPLRVFAGSRKGVAYDPADMSTLFQDGAGTIPVTAAGQNVRRVMDVSGNGNHATVSDTRSALVLGTDGVNWWLQQNNSGLHVPPWDTGSDWGCAVGMENSSGTFPAICSPYAVPPFQFSGIGASGDYSFVLNNVGGNTRLNGEVAAITRHQFYNAVRGQTVVAGSVGNDNASFIASSRTVMNYGSYYANGKIFRYAELDNATTAEVELMERWCARNTPEVVL